MPGPLFSPGPLLEYADALWVTDRRTHPLLGAPLTRR